MNTKKKTFHILPIIDIIKTKNTLTPQAKIDFDCSWNYYFSIRIGWMIFDKIINL